MGPSSLCHHPDTARRALPGTRRPGEQKGRGPAMISAINRATFGARTMAVVWFGQVISLVGSGMTGFPQGAWVYQ
jgi:hypothetical protein